MLLIEVITNSQSIKITSIINRRSTNKSFKLYVGQSVRMFHDRWLVEPQIQPIYFNNYQ